MGEIQILDCTLRDGGYINDWEFGNNNLVSIFERLVDAGIDMIEIGFLDERRPFDCNRSIMPGTDSVNEIYGYLNRGNAMVVGMIDYGTCGLENITPCKESFLDGIRVIFKKALKEEAMEFCAELKKLGYKVFAQLVSVTSYTDGELMELIRLANEIRPYAVSMVDTYGLMHQNNLMHYFTLLNDNLDSQIALGYHGHNNFQMGYANCIAMLSNEVERMLVVDGSIYGMGKSAGNAPTELIAMYVNQKMGKKYHISQLLEAIDTNISQFYQPATWGYNMFYYLAASNDCHPNYVADLLNKRTLSVTSVNKLLGKLKGEKKLLYDREYMENIYIEYQNKEVNDSEAVMQLKQIFENKEILLVGPGASIQNEREKIERFVTEKKPVVISVNYIPDYPKPDYIFLTNSKRYVQIATTLSRGEYTIIATSNVTCSGGEFDFTLNVSPLLDLKAEIVDNSLVMLLKTMISLKIKYVTLAGFDGYSKEGNNYFNINMEYDFVKKRVDYLNEYTIGFLREHTDRITVEFLTDSVYNKYKK